MNNAIATSPRHHVTTSSTLLQTLASEKIGQLEQQYASAIAQLKQQVPSPQTRQYRRTLTSASAAAACEQRRFSQVPRRGFVC
jgi:hypothetical protein